MTLEDVLAAVEKYPTRLVEITGGEPLEQDEAYPLMDSLLARNYTVMLETGGHVRLDRVPQPVIKIIDIKCPDSGEGHTFCWENIALAAPHDEFKFVIASRKDYEWSRDVVRNQLLKGSSNTILFSPAHEEMPTTTARRMGAGGRTAGSGPAPDPQIHLGSRRPRAFRTGEGICHLSLFVCHLSFVEGELLPSINDK